MAEGDKQEMANGQDDAGANGMRLVTAQDYLDRVILELRTLSSDRKGEVLGVLEYLSLYIRRTRDEVLMLKRQDKDGDVLSTSADELEEILTETAKAANDIMAAAERIEEIGATADPETAAALSDAVTRIYEASAFQDITGQRITKVVRALQHIETRIGALAEACEDSAMASGVVLPDSSDPMGDGIISDADLLNGPQLSKDANTQSEIDRLFGD